jgi:hypothetical protein
VNFKLDKLATRKALLITTISTQRTELAQALSPLNGPFSVAEQGLAALRFVGRHPELLAGAAIIILITRPGRILGWLRGGWLAWRVIVSLKRQL